MSINFRQPRYVLPLLALPFICLFFYVYHTGAAKDHQVAKQQPGFNGTVAEVSPDVKKRNLEDKLDAYRDRYKTADGAGGVTPIPSERSTDPAYVDAGRKNRQLDSIDSAMKQRFAEPLASRRPRLRGNHYTDRGDRQLADALNKLSRPAELPAATARPPADQDPMQLFKKQMAYMDSIRKMNDPAWQKQQQETKLKAEAKKTDDKTLTVAKLYQAPGDFNTVMPQREQQLITAVIDENVTGYAGSRIRLRLLEPIMAGTVSVPKDTYLYALVSGFSGQRVTFTIKTILFNGRLLPVKLEIYDQDGLAGLYVPDSRFRDFTKDLGTSTIQGVSTDNGSSSGSQFLMSTADKVFQSASGAVASAIRKNKAKIKYNAYIYLIDTKNLDQ